MQNSILHLNHEMDQRVDGEIERPRSSDRRQPPPGESMKKPQSDRASGLRARAKIQGWPRSRATPADQIPDEPSPRGGMGSRVGIELGQAGSTDRASGVASERPTREVRRRRDCRRFNVGPCPLQSSPWHVGDWSWLMHDNALARVMKSLRDPDTGTDARGAERLPPRTFSLRSQAKMRDPPHSRQRWYKGAQRACMSNQVQIGRQQLCVPQAHVRHVSEVASAPPRESGRSCNSSAGIPCPTSHLNSLRAGPTEQARFMTRSLMSGYSWRTRYSNGSEPIQPTISVASWKLAQ